MRTLKIMAAVLAAALVFSCEDPNYVPRTEYESLVKEYEDLKAGAQATREEYAAQAAAVDKILQDLSQITGRTVSLRANMEQGTAELTQVQQIEESIGGIKDRLSQLEKLSGQSAELKKMVKSLQSVITEKEAEIAQLKEEISRKDATIEQQHQTISEQFQTLETQNQTISAQRENLRSLLAEQAQMLFQAGVDFESLGDNAPEVRRHKDKEKLADFREEMYSKAILYYQQAQNAGYPEAGYRISQVNEKRGAL